MKILLTNYTGERANWGCQATSRGLLTFLKRAFSNSTNINIINVPLPKPHKIDSIHDAVYGDRIHRIYSEENPTDRDLEFLQGLVRERFQSFFRMALSADVVVFQGEGTIGPSQHLRTTRLFGIPYIASRLWRKPVLSMNQTIFAKDSCDERAIRNIFQSFKLIAVREVASLFYANKLGLSDVVFCPDMAFVEMGETISQIKLPEKPYFCVTGSAAAQHYDKALFSGIVSRISEKTGLLPVFLYSRNSDKKLVGENFKRENIISSPDFTEIIPLLRNAKFLFGGRYHTAVTALTQGTPVILLPGNTFKSEGLGPTLGISCPVYDLTETDAILSMARDILDTELEKREEVLEAVRKVRALHNDFSEYLVAGVEEGNFCQNGALWSKLSKVTFPGSQSKYNFVNLYHKRNSSQQSDYPGLKYIYHSLARRSRQWSFSIEKTFSNFS